MTGSSLLGLNDFITPEALRALTQQAFANNYVIRPSTGRTVQQEVRAVAEAYTNMQWGVFGIDFAAPSTMEMVLRDPDFKSVVQRVSPSSYPIGSPIPAGPKPTPPPIAPGSTGGQAAPGGVPSTVFSPAGSAPPGTIPVKSPDFLLPGMSLGPLQSPEGFPDQSKSIIPEIAIAGAAGIGLILLFTAIKRKK